MKSNSWYHAMGNNSWYHAIGYSTSGLPFSLMLIVALAAALAVTLIAIRKREGILSVLAFSITAVRALPKGRRETI